jgi:hypothetical protein
LEASPVDAARADSADFVPFEGPAVSIALASSSLQALLKFSDQQGSWERDGNTGLKGVVLALVFDDNDALFNVSRVDVSLHTVGSGCDTIAGSLEVREFTGAEDPLDPSTDTGDPIATDTFTGRRVKARG